MIPTFIIIGAQRCATGWISQCLREHPDIFMSSDETRFFDWHYEKGIEWWEKKYFSNYNGQKIVGEKTANYMYDPNVPGRIAKSIPNAKLVCCLRNPIDRLYSAYVLKIANNKDFKNLNILELIKSEKDLIERGFYYNQLKGYLNLLQKENILITIYEDKFHDPIKFIQDIYKFLNIEPEFSPPSLRLQVKAGSFEHKSFFLRPFKKILTSKKSPLIKCYSLIRPNNNGNRIETSVRNYLLGIFLPNIEKLEGFIKRDLAIWKVQC